MRKKSEFSQIEKTVLEKDTRILILRNQRNTDRHSSLYFVQGKNIVNIIYTVIILIIIVYYHHHYYV